MKTLLQDIKMQPTALQDHKEMISICYGLGRSLAELQSMPVVMTGMATSLYAWQTIEFLAEYTDFNKPWVIDSAEMLYYSLEEKDSRPLFVLSRSGRSVEIEKLMSRIPDSRLVVGITEDPESPLGKRAQHLLSFRANEQAFPNTKSFTLSLAYVLACANGLYSDERRPENWFSNSLEAVEAIIGDADSPRFHSIADSIARSNVLLMVARGCLQGVARQAVLDFHEGMRIAAIPICGGLFRHGSVELTARDDVITFILIPKDETSGILQSLANELHHRGAPVAAITAQGISLKPGIPAYEIPVELEKESTPIAFAVALQLLNVALIQRMGLKSFQPSLVDRVTLRE